MVVVIYLLSTSNHNKKDDCNLHVLLSYIYFLHQTTTLLYHTRPRILLSYIYFLHQTTTYINYLNVIQNITIDTYYIKWLMSHIHNVQNYQKSSSCKGVGLVFFSICPQILTIFEYCLSVMETMVTCPLSGAKALTLFIWT